MSDKPSRVKRRCPAHTTAGDLPELDLINRQYKHEPVCRNCNDTGQVDVPNSITLTFHYLPDLDKVGGNARPAQWADKHKDFQSEKRMWHGLIRAQLIPPMPHFARVRAHVTLMFREHRARDIDNCTIAMKPFWDAMKVPGPHPNDYGWGIIQGDDEEHLKVGLDVRVDRTRAPLTVVELTEV